MSIASVLATSSDAFPGFKLQTQISTVFVECDKHVLLLKRCHKEDQSNTWGVPGGKSEKGEKPKETALREVREETQIELSADEVVYHGHRYARIPGWDYMVHIYHVQMKERAVVKLDPKEHSAYEWVSIYLFKQVSLLKGQDEVFDIVYGNRFWQRITLSPSLRLPIEQTTNLVFRKGTRTLIFDAKRRFILNLIGTSGSGKGTQGEMLSKAFGISNISAVLLHNSQRAA